MAVAPELDFKICKLRPQVVKPHAAFLNYDIRRKS